MSVLNQLKSYRTRWQPRELDEYTEEIINRNFAATFNDPAGKAVLDYLIERYYKPLETGSTPLTAIELGERNGQQKLVVDILLRYDTGMHPMAFEPEHSSDDGKEVDVRQ